MNTHLNRRQFLGMLAAAGFAPVLRAQATAPHEYWVSAQGNRSARYALTSFDANGNRMVSALSGFRGHGTVQHALHPSSVIMFSRRPGTEAIDVDIQNGYLNRRFNTAKNRCFTGHGCFSKDGRLLYTCEADTNTGDGKIAVRDALDYRQLDEIDTHGIGPHQLMLMPDGYTLAVANGGILTRAETGRKKLNLDTMQSSLAYIDTRNGRLSDQLFVAEPKASIRHLDVAHDGSVVIAMQVQRKAMQHQGTVPLAGVHRRGTDIRLLTDQQTVIQHMNDYAGSVAVNNVTRVAGFTSPKGNLAVFWNIDSGLLAGYHQMIDVCGLTVSADQSQFVLSNSFGSLRSLDARTLEENRAARKQFADTQWDNHMITVVL